MGKLMLNSVCYTGGSGSGHNYSTTEQVVGTWVDGSTLYEKTFILQSNISIGTDWTNTGITLTDADKLVDVAIWRSNTNGYYPVLSSLDNTNLRLMNSFSFSLNANSTITVRYTKSST